MNEGETLRVYAKNAFGDQKSEEASYTRQATANEPPAAPVIEKPVFNRDRITITALDYDEIWYRYEYAHNKNKTKFTDWTSSFWEVTLTDSSILRVEAYVIKDGAKSETTTWRR